MKEKLYALMGNPVAQSLSPQVHQAFAEQLELPYKVVFKKILVKPSDFQQALQDFKDSGGQGLNFTTPLKMLALEYASQVSNIVEDCGSTNIFIRNGDSFLADNTDGVGFHRDLVNKAWPVKGKRILILGAGGAIKACLPYLIQDNPNEIFIANRNLDKALEIQNRINEEMGFLINTCSYESIPDGPFDLIIDGTSASLKNEMPPLPTTILSNSTYCYAMAYGPKLTPFLQWANNHGVPKEQLSGGEGMLVEQAAEGFFLWHGVMPKTEPVLRLIKDQLGS